jgi:hypothetical protein
MQRRPLSDYSHFQQLMHFQTRSMHAPDLYLGRGRTDLRDGRPLAITGSICICGAIPAPKEQFCVECGTCNRPNDVEGAGIVKLLSSQHMRECRRMLSGAYVFRASAELPASSDRRDERAKQPKTDKLEAVRTTVRSVPQPRAMPAIEGLFDQSGPLCTAMLNQIRSLAKRQNIDHCDICGHDGLLICCDGCPAAFHAVCLNKTQEELPKGKWICSLCQALKADRLLNRERQRERRPETVEPSSHKGKAGGIIRYLNPTEAGPAEKVLAARQCGSCGFHEMETVQCVSCMRAFCFGCMCLSRLIMPNSATWSCTECLGLDQYDEVIGIYADAVHQKIKEGRAQPWEVDFFGQLVFDLMSVCMWDALDKHMPLLVEWASVQVEWRSVEGSTLPVILPFHSLHYPMDKLTVRAIAECYSRSAYEEIKKKTRPAWWENAVPNVLHYPRHIVDSWSRRLAGEKQRLRVGYVSSDFVNHPTADLIQTALLLHDRERYEIFLYSLASDDKSTYRKTLKKANPIPELALCDWAMTRVGYDGYCGRWNTSGA